MKIKTDNYIKVIVKHLLILLSVCCLVSCKTTQKNKNTEQTNSSESSGRYSIFEKYKDKSLVIKKDDIGGLYYQTEEAVGKTIFLLGEEKNQNAGYMDGHYREEILFELDNSVFDRSFNDLKPEKVLFGVFCYCKGKAGYYSTESTLISFEKETKTITITIEQIIENQVLSTIKLVNE